MSLKEVQRANNCILSKNLPPAPEQIFGELKYIIDHGRFNSREGCPVNIWGDNMEITYDFFDDQLFRIRILDKVFNKNQTDSLIIIKLSEKFGQYKKGNERVFGGTFSTKITDVDYKQFSYTDNDTNEIID